MKILQAETFPLLGKRLIEASAGTGKTYTIANLYLRVLLGDHSLGLKPVDRILVVTFTRAATEELRGRIRDRIRQLYEDVLRLEQDPDDKNNQIAYMETDENGFYQINIDRNQDYKIVGSQKKYIDDYRTFTSKNI